MTDRTSKLFTVAQTRRIEAQAMACAGHDAWALMQRAGAAAFALMRARWPEVRRMLVVCGSGNNGGDGYVVAALARAAGIDVHVVQVGAAATRLPAATAIDAWRSAEGAHHDYRGGDLAAADLIVDALFGIGLDRAPDGLAADAITAVNRHPAPCFALDVPSGLNADSGATPGLCVEADATLSFIAWKRGQWTGAAARVCGARHLADLSLPISAFDGVDGDSDLRTDDELARALPPRFRDAHKGACGHVLLVGGDHGLGGAVMIAAQAALRSGAGLVSVATRGEHVAALLARTPECMVHAVFTGDDLDALLARVDVIVLGPGLGQGGWARSLAARVVASGKPVVVDADALNLLAANAISAPNSSVLTPHPGEAARLLGCDVAAIAHDRFAAVRALAQRFRAVVVLKGAGSLIASADGSVSVCPFGNPGMASAGMGDALSGVIAAFIAQGLSIEASASLGVVAHALAGDRAARDGERGLIASDLIAQLRSVVNR